LNQSKSGENFGTHFEKKKKIYRENADTEALFSLANDGVTTLLWHGREVSDGDGAHGCIFLARVIPLEKNK
jgi:hypothetical protein